VSGIACKKVELEAGKATLPLVNENRKETLTGGMKDSPLSGYHRWRGSAKFCIGPHHVGHSTSPVSLSSSQGSSPQTPVWSFPIIHLFSPPFEVEIHGVKIHLLLVVHPELLPEGPIEPFHHSTDMGDLGGRTKSLIPYSCEDPQIPRRIHFLQYLLARTGKGHFLRSSSRNTLARLAVALEWREE